MQHISPGAIVLVFSIVVAFVALFLLILNKIISFFVNRHRLKPRSNEMQFECGLNPTGGPAERLSISYFLVAAAFLVFELESAILLPWAVNFWHLGASGIVAAITFMVILLLGLIYMLAKGALKL